MIKRYEPVTPFDQDPEPVTWPRYLSWRWGSLPTWAKVFLGTFVTLLAAVTFGLLAAWFLSYGWVIPGVITICAAVAAFVTGFAALVTEGFSG
jgi:hypothetical protein